MLSHHLLDPKGSGLVVPPTGHITVGMSHKDPLWVLALIPTFVLFESLCTDCVALAVIQI